MFNKFSKNTFDFLTLRSVSIFAALFLTVFLLHGKPIPFANEFQYLLQLIKESQPNSWANDWTLAGAGNEHWLFNRIFSPFAYLVSIEFLIWFGRIAGWTILLALLLCLGAFWQIPLWQRATAIFLWLCCGQAAVGGEFIFGTFEAKIPAYVCLLAALLGFGKKKIAVPSVLLGLTFCFHPSVGLLSIPAVGAALLFVRIPARQIFYVIVLTAIFSLPGILALLPGQLNQAASSPSDWRFIALVRYPEFLNPFEFSRSVVALLFLMSAFNFWALRQSENFALRFLTFFQIALGAIFLCGIGLRFFEKYELLRFMPFRLFPLFTPLFFLLTAFHVFARLKSGKHKAFLAVFAALSIAWLNPIGKTFVFVNENYRVWTTKPDDLQKSLCWLAENSPPTANIIQPLLRRDTWLLSRRAQIVSYTYPTYEKLAEWRERIGDLTGDLPITDSKTADAEIETAYNNLTPEQINKIRRKYGATHLVSRGNYSYPVAFQTPTYKVYNLETIESFVLTEAK